MREVFKGEVYWANIPIMKDSSIQAGVRPVIIWCNNKAGKYSPVVQYIPVTSKTEKMRRKKLPVQVFLEEQCPQKDSVALVEQFGCIDKSRLMEKICTLTKRDMFNIMKASMIQQDMDIYEMMKDMKQFACA
jgi:mRNA-degrading endonuclease toxin of MazEF toxin-antitoxin module